MYDVSEDKVWVSFALSSCTMRSSYLLSASAAGETSFGFPWDTNHSSSDPLRLSISVSMHPRMILWVRDDLAVFLELCEDKNAVEAERAVDIVSFGLIIRYLGHDGVH